MNTEKLFDEELRIESKDLLLRPVRTEDSEALLLLYGDESIYRYRPGMPRKTVRLVEKLIRRFREDACEGRAVALSVIDREQGCVVGLAEVFHLDPKVEQAEIGCSITPEYQGRGLATRAVKLLTDYLILEADFNRVRATVHVENIGSRRVYEKAGFTLEGQERQGEFWQGLGLVDICRYAILKMDYVSCEEKK